ncbi:methyl viologen resistance protein SmvA [Serratia fonticola]|uniref:Methyl viologen resistance protein SmvA n=2 Tax=Serratia fonticola TaxID=47917 RepID=A0A448STZ4_SERFO|nr:methyl viologen resistance protein SmvA [Serratia fonticola]
MTAVYSHSLVLPANLPVGDLAYDSIDEALRLAGNMGADSAERLIQLARGAFDQAFIAVLIAAALLTSLSAGVLKFALRKRAQV